MRAPRPITIIFAIASGVTAQATDRPSELTEEAFPAVLTSILPSPVENQWRQVPWCPDLTIAIEDARAKDKPILLWAMNGHPCGMT